MLRIMRLCFLMCMLAAISGCARAGMWGYELTVRGQETFDKVVVSYGKYVWPLGDDFSPGLGGSYMGAFGRPPVAADIRFMSRDGRRHSVFVVVPPEPPPRPNSGNPEAFFVIEGRVRAVATWQNADKAFMTKRPLDLRPRTRWFCAIGDEGRKSFSRVTVRAGGRSYRLGDVGAKADTALSALGPMPKVLTISFTSPDGKRHKVRVQAAAATTFHGSKTPELYVLIGSHAKLTASWLCPPLLKYKPPPHWTCSILDIDPGVISHVTMACDGKPPFTAYDVLGGPNSSGGSMNPKGLAPKAIDLGFTTSDGIRHTVHVVMPTPRGSGQPSFTLTIEKGGKVVATSP